MRISNIKKSFENKIVLDIDDFEFRKGSVYALVGANGSGKTTLARIMAGITSPDSGSVSDAGVVRYMPQKSYVFRMSVVKNVLLSGKSNDRKRAGKLLDSLGILALSDAKAKRLSGGETAKCALARVLMDTCDTLILDEPCAAMDIQSTIAAEKTIKQYAEETGCTIILITHSIKQALRTADYALFMADGRICEHGSVNDLFSNPQKEETKEFLEYSSL